VEYWKSLYAALDPDLASPLYPFWIQYYALAQYLNDVQDFEEDRRWKQPNLLSIHLSDGNGRLANCPPFQSSVERAVQPEVLALIENKFQELAGIAGSLPPPERDIAQLKLYESLQEVVKLGLYSLPHAQVESPAKPSRLRLSWYSEIDQVVQEAGASAIEKVDCPVCGSEQGNYLFQKQGFPFNRCQDCSHVYVSPRVKEDVQHHILENVDGLNMEDKYLEAQRLYAESICHLLSLKVSGARMLDIGFGHGYLMHMARAYGFEVYGIDAAQAHVDQMQPLLGSRVAHCVLGQSPIPWDSFDVVVMSHILEHMPYPRASLEEVSRIMNPGGFLFIAVPDIDSTLFKIFGKHWDVINPLVHYQYFSGASLVRLLEECQFEGSERINFPQLPDEILPRWTRLMRQMGGSENSEMIYLAKKPV
jgi:2-polyprenyl-3-methyl-5-hydroxy-6-metoxy-1,4-benzoquinol methylase